MFHDEWELERFQTAEERFQVIASFDTPYMISFSVLLQLCLYLAPLTRYYHLFPKI